MSEEIWKPIPNTEYDASSWGSIRTRATGRILSQRLVKSRFRTYARVKLMRGQPLGGKTFHVHRLVLEAFVGPRPPMAQCRHLNDDPLDNRLENLVWTPGGSRA